MNYDPFGNQTNITGSPGTYSYNGNEFDDEWDFDLYYYGARFMDPALGRFITPDPVNDFINPYSYVGNNPMNMIDPTGMAMMPAIVYSVIQSVPPWEANRVDIVESVKQQSLNGALQERADYIRGLMNDAAAEARSMKSVDQSESLNKDWEDIADVLNEWADMSDDEILASIVDIGGINSAIYPKWDDKGDLKSAKLLLNENSFFGGGKTRTDLIGFLIHEAANYVFMNKHSNYIGYAKSEGCNPDDLYQGYVELAEMNAYSKHLDVISKPSNINNITKFKLEAKTWGGYEGGLNLPKGAVLDHMVDKYVLPYWWFY